MLARAGKYVFESLMGVSERSISVAAIASRLGQSADLEDGRTMESPISQGTAVGRIVNGAQAKRQW